MNSTPDAPELPPLPARWSIERIYAGPAQGYLVSGPDGSASVWPTDRNPKLILFKLAEALAARQPEPVAHVAIPKSADEAELMLKLGHLWLTQNAPERLAQPPADLKDAQRYRWLRGGKEHMTRWPRWQITYWDGHCWNPLEQEALDRSLDAAMANKPITSEMLLSSAPTGEKP